MRTRTASVSSFFKPRFPKNSRFCKKIQIYVKFCINFLHKFNLFSIVQIARFNYNRYKPTEFFSSSEGKICSKAWRNYMYVSDMLSQSGILTLLGMGVVFSFLIIMILSMVLMHAIIHALKWDKEPEKKETAQVKSAAPAAADEGAVVAAIAAAVHEKLSV